MLITISDFAQAGKYELHTGIYDQGRLQNYIDKYTKRYLVELLGADLFAEFEADLILGSGVPTEQRFLDIFNPLSVDYNWTIIYSEGMAEMLKGFVYFEYIKDMVNQTTPIGMVRPMGENSGEVTPLYMMCYARYNEAVRSYKAIQEYICDNSGDYSEFNGKRKQLAYWI